MKGKNHMYGVWKEKREAEKGADIAKEEAQSSFYDCTDL